MVEAGVDEAYLIRRAQEGYLDAYAELVGRHAALAYRVALRVLGNHHDAEDVAQMPWSSRGNSCRNSVDSPSFPRGCTGSSADGR